MAIPLPGPPPPSLGSMKTLLNWVCNVNWYRHESNWNSDLFMSVSQHACVTSQLNRPCVLAVAHSMPSNVISSLMHPQTISRAYRSLSHNSLTGSIPSDIFSLRQLTYLYEAPRYSLVSITQNEC
ncbi:unnamed protein product [Closterium sp. Yama58-4]|nr:unnamed protein product [Closterium sp. Yama58-4]